MRNFILWGNALCSVYAVDFKSGAKQLKNRRPHTFKEILEIFEMYII